MGDPPQGVEMDTYDKLLARNWKLRCALLVGICLRLASMALQEILGA